MKRRNYLWVSFFAIAVAISPASGQDKKSSAPAPVTKPLEATVWFNSWDGGEIKTCVTLPREPGTSQHTAFHSNHRLLICDNDSDWPDSYMNRSLAGIRNGLSQDESDAKALDYIVSNGKRFLVKFSKEPWPKPSKDAKASRWTCTKTDIISCSLIKSTDKQ